MAVSIDNRLGKRRLGILENKDMVMCFFSGRNIFSWAHPHYTEQNWLTETLAGALKILEIKGGYLTSLTALLYIFT